MTSIPRFVLFNQLGWVGTFLPLTVPHFFGGGFNIFLVMQFIRGIPKDMDEAAVIDGCNWYKIFLRIVLPLIVPRWRCSPSSTAGGISRAPCCP